MLITCIWWPRLVHAPAVSRWQTDSKGSLRRGSEAPYPCTCSDPNTVSRCRFSPSTFCQLLLLLPLVPSPIGCSLLLSLSLAHLLRFLSTLHALPPRDRFLCLLFAKTTRGRFHTNPRERTLTRLRRIASRDWIEPLHNAISSPPSPPCSTFRSRYFSLSVLLSASHPFDAVIDNACTPAWPPPCHRRFSLPPPPTDGDTFIDGQFAVWDFILFFFFFGTLKFYFIKIVKNFF